MHFHFVWSFYFAIYIGHNIIRTHFVKEGCANSTAHNLPMKKIFFGVIFIVFISPCISVLAAPKCMPDGNLFDAAYYGSCYPDVVSAVGTSESALYNHYLMYGKAEGRKPYASPNIDVEESNTADPDIVIQSVNTIRTEAGIPALKENEILDNMALVRANDMIENHYFSHEKNGEIMMVSVVENAGYAATEIGENLGRSTGETSDLAIQGIVSAWEISRSHSYNIDDETYSRTGVAIVEDTENKEWYIVQLFSD